jgi:electron transfer flavoprotein beta subunit
MMNIVICVKQVPDTAVERTLKPGAGTLDRETPDGLINELDEYAIEEGLKIAEAYGGEVTILSMSPAKASESIRKALSMGADKAVHISDEALAGSDVLATSLVLAEALKQTGFDLVILGSESTDARTGVASLPLSQPAGEVVNCPMDDGSAEVLALAYPGRPDVDLWVWLNGCGGVSNGYLVAAGI